MCVQVFKKSYSVAVFKFFWNTNVCLNTCVLTVTVYKHNYSAII